MSITSDYLQFYPEDFEGKASNGTLPAMFIQNETSMSVFHFKKCPKRTFFLIVNGHILKSKSNLLIVKYLPVWAHKRMYVWFMVTYAIIISYL